MEQDESITPRFPSSMGNTKRPICTAFFAMLACLFCVFASGCDETPEEREQREIRERLQNATLHSPPTQLTNPHEAMKYLAPQEVEQ